jgi:hypothetical protein
MAEESDESSDDATVEWVDAPDADDGPAPLPVLPLDDVPPTPVWPVHQRARPVRRGARAIGIISLIVAVGSLLAGVATILFAGQAYQGSVARASEAAAAARVAAESALVEGPAELLARDGLPAADRSAVADALSAARPMSEGEQRQLDELLAEAGRRVLDPTAVTVSASGQLTGVGATSGPAFYVLPTGRLELSDDRVAFLPADGQPTIAAVAYELPPSPTVEEPPLSDAATRSVLRAIARLNGGRPRSAQVRAIAQLLRGSGQHLVVPLPGTVDPAVEVTAVTTDGTGQLAVHTVHGGTGYDLSVTPGGQISANVGPAAGASALPSAAGLTAVRITSAGQMVVAAYLLVAAALTPRESGRTRPLLWTYVALKIPVGVAAAVAVGLFARSVASDGSAVAWAVPTIVGLAYPLVLAILMCLRNGPELGRAA